MKPQTKKTLSRREALKTLAAVSGVAVLMSVKNKWETPLVQVGVLPAHAQASRAATLIVRNSTSGTIIVTVNPLNASPLTSLDTQNIPRDGAGTFSLTPGTYDIEASPDPSEENCFEGWYDTAELEAGETEERDVTCDL